MWLAGAALALVVAWWAARRAPPTGVSDADTAALRELNEILASKNDNDPRLDRDFNALSPVAKMLLRDRYAQLPRERRNELGTIVYLLGKNMADKDDWDFLRRMAAEPPCLSLSDCSKSSARAPGDAVTLAYPALVALKQAETALKAGRSVEEARSVVEAGKSSKVPAVVRLARRIESTQAQSPAKP